MKIRVEFLYRDGANYKDVLIFDIDLEKYPEAKELKVGSEIEMGQYGIPDQEDMFNEHISHGYDPEYDHNLLDVEKIIPLPETEDITIKNVNTVLLKEQRDHLLDMVKRVRP